MSNGMVVAGKAYLNKGDSGMSRTQFLELLGCKTIIDLPNPLAGLIGGRKPDDVTSRWFILAGVTKASVNVLLGTGLVRG